MPKFEVHIPASEPDGFNMTLKVGADNWMAALKAGMQKLGEQGTVSQNVMVDIHDDNSIHVTEAHSGRVFRIRELTDAEVARAQVKRPSGLRPASRPDFRPTVPFESSPTEPGASERGADAPTPLPTPMPTPAPLPAGTPTMPAILPPTMAAAPTLPAMPAVHALTPVAPVPSAGAKAPPPKSPAASPTGSAPDAPPPPRVARPSGITRLKSSPRLDVADVEELLQPLNPVTRDIGRPKSSPRMPAIERGPSPEEILADVFLRIVELDGMTSVEVAMEFILDLALEKVPSESGAVFRADGATGDLTFMAARGPKAKEVLASAITIPAGTGIAGFCAVEGVSVAVSDVEKDPRHYSAISAQVNYTPKSMLCAPMMTHGHSFGCVQLINRSGGPQFQEHEVGLLAYLAHQAALFLNARLLG